MNAFEAEGLSVKQTLRNCPGTTAPVRIPVIRRDLVPLGRYMAIPSPIRPMVRCGATGKMAGKRIPFLACALEVIDITGLRQFGHLHWWRGEHYEVESSAKVTLPVARCLLSRAPISVTSIAWTNQRREALRDCPLCLQGRGQFGSDPSPLPPLRRLTARLIPDDCTRSFRADHVFRGGSPISNPSGSAAFPLQRLVQHKA